MGLFSCCGNANDVKEEKTGASSAPPTSETTSSAPTKGSARPAEKTTEPAVAEKEVPAASDSAASESSPATNPSVDGAKLPSLVQSDIDTNPPEEKFGSQLLIKDSDIAPEPQAAAEPRQAEDANTFLPEIDNDATEEDRWFDVDEHTSRS